MDPQPEAGDDELDELVVDCLGRMESEGDAALEALCAVRPTFASRLRSRIEALREAGLIGATASSDPADFPERLGDFVLLRRLGGGGMGVVYLARQESLDREVALKLIRPEHMYFPGARERFQREVAIVAKLQHPGVVPVLLFGEERGVPYFAMEHVLGMSLGDVLEIVRGRDPATLSGSTILDAILAKTNESRPNSIAPLYAGSWEDACARIVREVAEALEHVHRRGIVHRDVKPSNVMITREGRVMLLDFGLSSSQGVDRMTRSGTVMGSMPYSSPEQLQRGPAALDARSDVYSLGVMLYELLTLELPYDGPSSTALQTLILDARPVRVGQINPSVRWELQTVCETAMEVDPMRRYASAAEFARDLSNVLERRPIDAKRATTGLLVRRWIERNPARAALVLAVALLVVGAPSLYAWQQRERTLEIAEKNSEIEAKNTELRTSFAKEQELRATADQQRARAEVHLEAALGAVRTMLTQVGDSDLRDVPEMDDVRRELLVRALEFYQGFVRTEGDSPTLRKQLCAAHERVANLMNQLGRHGEGLAASERSIAMARELLVLDGNEEDVLDTLQRALSDRTQSLRAVDRIDEAIEVAREAVDVCEKILATSQNDVRFATDVAEAWNQLAAAYERAERTAEAVEAREAGLDVLDALDAGSEERVRSTRASLLTDLGSLRFNRGEIPAARERFRAAVELAQASFDAQPSSRRRRLEFARSLGSLVNCLNQSSDGAEARAMSSRALKLLEELVRDFPRDSLQRRSFVVALINHSGLLNASAGDPNESLRCLERAATEQLALIADEPDVPDHEKMLSMVYGNQAAVLRALNRLEDASDAIERALENETRAEARSHSPLHRGQMAMLHTIAADIFVQRKLHERALVSAEAALRAQPELGLNAIRAASRMGQSTALLANDPLRSEATYAAQRARYLDATFGALDAAVTAGFVDWKAMSGSKSFLELHSDERWRELEARVRSKQP